MKKDAFTTQQMIAALHHTKGGVYLAAAALGCAPQTIYNHVRKHPTVKAALDTERGRARRSRRVKIV